MKSINKKIITVSLILLIACSLPILMEENRVFNDIKIKNIEHIIDSRGGNKNQS